MTNNNENTITYREAADRLTIELAGAAFANLRKVADAMNRVPWCDDDNSPLTIVRNFAVGDILADFAANPRSISSDILEGIDAGFKDGTPEYKARIAELRAAFEAAGV